MNRHKLAVIFDNDGVLVDSEGISEEAFVRAAAEQGVRIDPARMERYCGLTDAAIAEDLASEGVRHLDLHQFEARKRELYFELAAAEPGVQAFSGARPLIERLLARKIPVAVASSGSRSKVCFNLERADLDALLPHRVCGDEVKRGKPDPEIFLKAARLLEVEPAGCVVLEDSINGLKAARAAGMATVGVATTFPPERLLPHADHVAGSLEEITPGRLEEVARMKAREPERA